MTEESRFVRCLKESRESVWTVASWLKESGYRVRILPSLVRPTFEERHSYRDGGDIEIIQRVEVKHRQLDFTDDPESYDYESVMLGEVGKLKDIPAAQLREIVILSRDQLYACTVPASTRSSWSIVEKFDRLDQRHTRSFVCPKELCSFHKIGKKR